MKRRVLIPPLGKHRLRKTSKKKGGFKFLTAFVFLAVLFLIVIIYCRVAYKLLFTNEVDQGHNIQNNVDKKDNFSGFSRKKKSLYDPSKMMFLNMTSASMLRDHEPNEGDKRKFSIDILTIGSVNSIEKAKTQSKSWGSHVSRRHFLLATEFDDPDPNCHTKMTLKEVGDISRTCSTKGNRYWEEHGALNDYTKYLKNFYAQERWLLAKANPQGWLCAQKRFLFALSKLIALYRESKHKYDVDLPDYLIFNDDDTYLNLEMFEEQLLRTPQKEVKEKGYTFQDELLMVYPTPNVPVVFAGCRVRRPTNQVHDTFPFGGYGVMISKGALERFMQPLYCNETRTGFEWEACEQWTPAYSNWSIAEKQYFKPGMSISDLMGSYVQNIYPFCVHSGKSIYFYRYLVYSLFFLF